MTPLQASTSSRFFLCARCRCQVVICRACDRGQIYCQGGCAEEALRDRQRRAGRRYAATPRGRERNRERQRRHRERKAARVRESADVTHRGSSEAPPTDTSTSSEPVASTGRSRAAPTTVSHGRATEDHSEAHSCAVCGSFKTVFVRLDSLWTSGRRRRRRRARLRPPSSRQPPLRGS